LYDRGGEKKGKTIVRWLDPKGRRAEKKANSGAKREES